MPVVSPRQSSPVHILLTTPAVNPTMVAMFQFLAEALEACLAQDPTNETNAHARMI